MNLCYACGQPVHQVQQTQVCPDCGEPMFHVSSGYDANGQPLPGYSTHIGSLCGAKVAAMYPDSETAKRVRAWQQRAES